MSSFRPRADPWAQDPNVLYVRPSVRILGGDFGREELRHVALAMAALVTIFACGLAGGITSPAFGEAVVLLLPISLVACAPTFFVALLLQKRIGARGGCTVEFRVEPQWLGISVFFSVLLGFVFAVPGSLQRFGNLSRPVAGRIGLAAPGTFLAVAGAGFALAYFAWPLVGADGWVFLIFLVQITSLLALFQMLPVAGFPGLDLWRWSKVAYAGTLAAGVVLFALSRAPELVFS